MVNLNTCNNNLLLQCYYSRPIAVGKRFSFAQHFFEPATNVETIKNIESTNVADEHNVVSHVCVRSRVMVAWVFVCPATDRRNNVMCFPNEYGLHRIISYSFVGGRNNDANAIAGNYCTRENYRIQNYCKRGTPRTVQCNVGYVHDKRADISRSFLS